MIWKKRFIDSFYEKDLCPPVQVIVKQVDKQLDVVMLPAFS